VSQDKTIPVRQAGHPIRGIRVEVRDGPDRGARAATASETLTIGTAQGNDLVLTDPTVSRFHLTLKRNKERIAVTDHDSTNGTWVGPAHLRNASVEVRAGTVLEVGETRLAVDDGAVVLVDEGPEALGELRGRSPGMRQLFALAGKAAGADVPVLIQGESGTGKELLARAIHDHSERREGPFVTLDAGALSPTLFASELFGHERGAFTGADRRRIGAFERAVGGTVFLDEIGELPEELQASLLGVLERGRLRRVGGNEEVPVDVRIVSATNRDLHAEVNAGRFRLDLFYRLAVVRLLVPPLRERLQDIPLLVDHFVAESGHAGGARGLFDEAAMGRFTRHGWPGNVRELKNAVLGTLALGQAPELAPSAPVAGADPIAGTLGLPYRDARRLVTEEFERRYLTHLLERAGGSIRKASRDAAMDRSYLMELLRRHGFR
jgi:DNA-binding NtrC family response regulator